MSAERNEGLDLRSIKKVHAVGVAGSGVSGMVGLLLSRGMEVSGSEHKDSETLKRLRSAGVKCSVGHSRANVPPDADLVLISAAIGPENPEVALARERGIPVLKYAQLLGRLAAEKKGIAIAGTHGKTTTTAMVASVLAGAGRDPAFLIGGEYPGLGGGSRWGTGEFFVVEACEFDRSFLNIHPFSAIVTNIEEDHLDYFESLAEIRDAFGEFAGRIDRRGHLVLNADDPASRHLPASTSAAWGSFSLRPGEGDFWAEDVEPAGGGIRFRARSREGDSLPVALKVPGIHNVKNALATLALLRRIGLAPAEVVKGLEGFGGVRRRFEILRREPVVVIDDYAHHPTEIAAVLRAARETFPRRRVKLIFQPHQHSRTRRFLRLFAQVLAQADEAVLAEVFRARDSQEEVARVNSAALSAEVKAAGGVAVLAPSFPDILDHLRSTAVPGDVLICLGAGDITLLARRIADEPWTARGPAGPAAGEVLEEGRPGVGAARRACQV